MIARKWGDPLLDRIGQHPDVRGMSFENSFKGPGGPFRLIVTLTRGKGKLISVAPEWKLMSERMIAMLWAGEMAESHFAPSAAGGVE